MHTNRKIESVGEIACRLVEDSGKVLLKKQLKHIVRKVQKYGRDTMSSADDSGIKNLWDEYCVQVQDEAGFNFSLVEDLIHDICEEVLEDLRKTDSLSYRTIELYLNINYQNLLSEDEMQYIDTSEALFLEVKRLASDYSNQRITTYLDR